jgi:hypothetical protein
MKIVMAEVILNKFRLKSKKKLHLPTVVRAFFCWKGFSRQQLPAPNPKVNH